MNTASKKAEPSKRVTVTSCCCTGGCSTRLFSECPELAMCLPCLGLYAALDSAGVSSVAGLERYDRTVDRILAVLACSGAADADDLARDFRALIAG